MLTEPTALAPEPGREQAVGETSGSAEAFGIRAGMPISEALGPLPPAHPRAARSEPDGDRMGADPPQARGNRRGGGERRERRGVLRGRRVAQHLGPAARGRPREGRAGRRGSGPGRRRADPLLRPRRGGHDQANRAGAAGSGWSRPARSGTSSPPSPSACSIGRSAIGPGARTPPRGGWSRPSSASASRPSATWPGSRGSPSPIASAQLGLQAHDLASGLDTPLRPRVPHEDLVQAIGLPEAAYGTQLDRALDLLIERLLGIRSARVARSARSGSRRGSRVEAAGAPGSP